jgi:serine-type D-Ala-D-Ala carboxypeptidase
MAPDYNSLGRVALPAIDNHVIPGVIVAAGQAGQVGLLEAFGQRQVEPEPAPATVGTVYDLASLTKAVVTSLLVMKGAEEGLLHLDRPLGDHLEMLKDRPEVTIRRVLSHAGGFPAHRKFYESLLAKPEPCDDPRVSIINLAAAEPLVYEPGSRSIYSDLGFILLGALVEQAMSERLDVLADRMLFRPLQLSSTGFVDLCTRGPRAQFHDHAVAPTERCPVRGRLILGEVHDLNAFAMGGIAGHAGLFGSIQDLLEISFALCAAYHGRGVAGCAPLVAPVVLREFWQPAGIPGSTWRLGWDGPAAQGSLAGALISRRAVGHLSFTGCSLWIDPEQETCVIILCNRIHPQVHDDPRFRAFRPALHDAALQAIGYRAG